MDLPLRDIHLPEAIPDWSISPMFWIMLFAFLLVILAAFFLIKRLLRETLKKQALETLKTIKESFEETGDASSCITRISIFLRRVVLSRNKHENLAGITGQRWLELLDKSLDTPDFSKGAGQILLTGPYTQKVDETEVTELLELCSRWVKTL